MIGCRGLSGRTLLWLGLPALLLAASFGAAVGAVRLVRADGDRVKILGSGDGVSILITTGRTDLLIATGTDRTAFGNAYDSVAIGPGSRPDIVLVAGSGHSLNVPTSAIELYPDAETFAIHPLETGPAGRHQPRSGAPIPRNPIRFTLDGRITVIVESLPIDEDGAFAWRAIITREQRGSRSFPHASMPTCSPGPIRSPPSSSQLMLGRDGGPINATAIIGPAAEPRTTGRSNPPEHHGTSPSSRCARPPGQRGHSDIRRSGIELTSDDRMYGTGRAG